MKLIKEKYTTIIWDWNGTLLNDLNVSIESMNMLLIKRQLPQLTKEHYKEVFGFPVIDYYQKLGFDFGKEAWENVAAEFMQAYHNKESTFELYEDAITTLEELKRKGYSQYILSAMKTASIEKMLKNYGIINYFDGIYGLDHHYADGKVEKGRDLLKNEQLSPQECILCGDTIHDAEVSKKLGLNCILICDGHQSVERLEATKYPVIQRLSELTNKF